MLVILLLELLELLELLDEDCIVRTWDTPVIASLHPAARFAVGLYGMIRCLISIASDDFCDLIYEA